MVCYPYDDLTSWSNPYPPTVLAAQFAKVAEGWAKGVKELEAAGPLVPEHLRTAAAADLRVAQAAQLHFASTANQIRFVLARDALLNTTEPEKRKLLLDELVAILDNEIAIAREMYQLAATDSRLGFEASNHYFYVPHDLIEKAVNCSHLRAQFSTGQSNR
jgi:hypothetical protein